MKRAQALLFRTWMSLQDWNGSTLTFITNKGILTSYRIFFIGYTTNNESKMREVISEIAMSLDGFIEGPNGELNWLIFDEEVSFAIDLLSRFDTIFNGRAAYEKFGIHKVDPAQPEAEREFHSSVNNIRKYVFSHFLKQEEGNGIVINDNIETEVKKIRQVEGKDIWRGLLKHSWILILLTSMCLLYSWSFWAPENRHSKT